MWCHVKIMKVQASASSDTGICPSCIPQCQMRSSLCSSLQVSVCHFQNPPSRSVRLASTLVGGRSEAVAHDKVARMAIQSSPLHLCNGIQMATRSCLFFSFTCCAPQRRTDPWGTHLKSGNQTQDAQRGDLDHICAFVVCHLPFDVSRSYFLCRKALFSKVWAAASLRKSY